ncbi:MAG: transglutaminase domain-containing protein [Spirochaetes bacterium]|nr:transglutaminase domain-containing protein [Spirochaetota bacterium]
MGPSRRDYFPVPPRTLCALLAGLLGAAFALTPSGAVSFAWKLYTPINFNLTNQKERRLSIDLYGDRADPRARQLIERQEIRYNLSPNRTNLETNACGDLAVVAAFRPVRTGWWTGTVSYEQMLQVTRGLDLSPWKSSATFPLPAAQRLGPLVPFLAHTEGVTFAATPLERAATDLVCRTRSTVEAVAAIAAWNLRTLAPEADGATRAQGSAEVFERKSGSLLGRLRVFVAMCRAAGIPTRFVLGQRVDTDIPVKGTLPWIHPGGRGDAWWAESRLSDGEWAPVDLQGTLFFLWPNVIRKKADADLGKLLGATEGFTEHNYELAGQSGSGLAIDAPGRPLIAPLSEPANAGIAVYLSLLEKRGILPKGDAWKVDPLAFGPGRGDALAETLRLEAGSQETWAQRFELSEAAALPALELLLRRMDSQGGILSLELCRDQDGGAGPAVYAAEVPTWKVGEGGVWRPVRFSLANAKTKAPARLEAGIWWCLLRLKGEGILHWGAGVDVVAANRAAFKLGPDRRPKLRVDGDFCVRRAGAE